MAVQLNKQVGLIYKSSYSPRRHEAPRQMQERLWLPQGQHFLSCHFLKAFVHYSQTEVLCCLLGVSFGISQYASVSGGNFMILHEIKYLPASRICKDTRERIALMEHHDQNNLRREGFVSFMLPHLCSSWKEIRTDTETGQAQGDRSWSRGYGEVLLTGLAFLAYSVCSLVEPRTTHNNPSLLISITNFKNIPQAFLQPDLLDAFWFCFVFH